MLAGASPGRKASPETIITWIMLVILAALAWIETLDQARIMGHGIGAMGMPLLPFLIMWMVMMVAMMSPAIAPVTILWGRSILGATRLFTRTRRMALFVTGYLCAWSAVGVMAFLGFSTFGSLLEKLPRAAGWLGATIFLIAGFYQLSPLKDLCLSHCRSPMSFLARYTGLRGPAVDFRVGLYHGLYCVGCCWALMAILVVVGVMNIAVMAGLSALISVEKLWRHGAVLGLITGYTLIGSAVLVILFPEVFPGLRAGQ